MKGFISAENIGILEITNVKFLYNTAYSDHLLFIKLFETIKIQDCEFSYNIVESLIYVDSDNL